MGALGFMGTYVPERYGGSGLDAVSYALIVEEINRACASTGVFLCTHVSLAVDPILHHGNGAQKEKYLPRLARGEWIGCFALSEPASGSDAAAMRTSARRDGDHWILNGTKNFITNGSLSNVAIVFAQTDPAQKRKGIAAFIVEKGTPGFSVGKLEKKLGIRGSDTAQLIFQDARVPAANLLGEVNEGYKIALSTLDGGRISIAAQAVGIARACLEDALAYAKQREAFGKKVADFQAIQWMLADMATEIDAARLLQWRAWRLYQSMRLGRDEARIDHPWRRVRDELVVYLGQRKLLKRPYYIRGLAHAFIFWGFLVITIGTVDLLLNGILGFHVPGTGSGLFAWTIDIFAVLVLASIAIALVRRLFFPPPRMHVALDGYVILGMIALLMLTLLVFEGAGLSAGLLEKGYTPPPIANAILKSIFSRNVAGGVFPVRGGSHLRAALAFPRCPPHAKHLPILPTPPAR